MLELAGGDLLQFNAYFAHMSVWITNASDLNPIDKTLYAKVVNGKHTILDRWSLHNTIAEYVPTNIGYSLWWFPAHRSYSIMPTTWFHKI